MNTSNLFVIAMCHLARHHLKRQNNRLIIFLHLVTAGLKYHPSLWLHPTFSAAIKTQNQLRLKMLTCDGVRLGHQARQTPADGVTVPVG